MSLIGYARVSTAEGRQWQASTCLPPSSSTGTPPGWAKRSLGEDMPACPWSPSSCHTSRPSVGPTSCSPANTDGKNAELSLTCHFALFRNRPQLEARGIGLKSLHESIDTTSSSGKLIFHVFGALAEFERNLIRERTQAGLAAARARGRRGGRPKSLDAAKRAIAVHLYDEKKYSVKEICEVMGVSKPTLYKYIQAARTETT